MGKVAVVLAAVLAMSLLSAGCREATGRAEGGRYRDERLRFSVAVPDGWTAVKLGGDLAVELRGPAVGGQQHAMGHVFGRRELGAVDLDRVAAEVTELMREGLSGAIAAVKEQEEESGTAPPGAEVASMSREAAELGGLAGVRLVRPVKVGAALMRQEMLVASRGREVWALVVTIPAGADRSVTAAAQRIRESFEVR